MTIALTNEFYELSFITFFSCFKSNFTQLPCPQTLSKSEQLSGYNHRFLFLSYHMMKITYYFELN